MKNMLEYKNSQFSECSGAPTTPITLTVDDSKKKLILVVPGGVSMVERRAAESNARGIGKIGSSSKFEKDLGNIRPKR